MGDLAIIDLANKEVQIREIPQDLRRRFLGGRGINTYLLYNLVDEKTDPLSPENPLIFGAGLLCGSLGVANSRGNFSAKSPETGHLGDSSMGGFFPSEMRIAGFDHLVVKSRSNSPVYLWVHDGRIDFRPASHLEGLDTLQTQERIKAELGEPRAQVACIGPAGRKLVAWSCIMHGACFSSGRTGMGAVMGSKNLWAIAARGTRGLEVSSGGELARVVGDLYSQVVNTKGYLATSTYGTLIRLNNTRSQGYEGGYNHQCNMMEGGGEEFDADVFLDKYESGKASCFNCPTHCQHFFRIPDGPHAGVQGAGIHYGGAGGWGSQCGCSDWSTILRAWRFCDLQGLDTLSASAYTAWLMELYEKKIIGQKETGGLKLEWGNPEAIMGILEQVVEGRDLGALIAKGWMHAASVIGKESDYFMDHVKGLTIECDDVRGHRAQALGLATSTRGACHLRSRYTLEEFSLPPAVTEKLTGRPIPSDPMAYEGKEWACFWTECICSLADALGVCKFLTKWLSAGLIGIEEFSKWLTPSTGLDISPQELFEIGERIYNVERLFLARQGFRREHDNVPPKFTKPWTHGPRAGTRIEMDKFQELLSRYYQLHGWDEEGVPSDSTLERLGLERGADKDFLECLPAGREV